MTDGQTECQRVDPSGRRGRVKIQIFIQYDISYSFGKNTLLLSSADFEQQWLPLNGSYAKKVPHFRNSQDGSLHMVLSLKNFPSEKCRGERIIAKKKRFFLRTDFLHDPRLCHKPWPDPAFLSGDKKKCIFLDAIIQVKILHHPW